MKYLSVKEIAMKWNISERTVRNYCANNKIDGAIIIGKTWNIPDNAIKPNTKTITLLDILKQEKQIKLSGGIYHKLQIDVTYNSNHIEGSKLTHDQTRYIFDTKTININNNEIINIDDIIETSNHFRCIDIIIDNANNKLNEKLIKNLHYTLMSSTSNSNLDWFAIGEYKKRPNIVANLETTAPEDVSKQLKLLINNYNSKSIITLEDILDFHYKFERIHPFQDGNGRIGRLIILKECLKHNIVPFIIDDSLKLFYYRGLKQWNNQKGYLLDTCLLAQDNFKKYLDYFKIEYNK